MKYIDADKLITEIERKMKNYNASIEKYYNKQKSIKAERDSWKWAECKWFLNLINSLKQEQPDNWDDEYREDELLTRFAFYTYKDEDSVLYLSNVFVEETSRNKGFGTKILQAAEKVAETIGAIIIRLKAKRNSPVYGWYRKHGYGYLIFEGEYDWLEKNLEYLKPKQKQQEVDLEAIIKKYCMDYYNCDYPDQIQNGRCDPVMPHIVYAARHFYELGLNARKEGAK